MHAPMISQLSPNIPERQRIVRRNLDFNSGKYKNNAIKTFTTVQWELDTVLSMKKVHGVFGETHVSKKRIMNIDEASWHKTCNKAEMTRVSFLEYLYGGHLRSVTDTEQTHVEWTQ